MVSEELKSVVAQNCEEYAAPLDVRLLSNSSSSVSCENCSNYSGGQCSKESFQRIADMLSRN